MEYLPDIRSGRGLLSENSSDLTTNPLTYSLASSSPERLSIVDHFLHPTLRDVVRDNHLKGFPDLQRISKKFQKSKSCLGDVHAVFQAARRLPALINELQTDGDNAGGETEERNYASLDQVFIQPLTQSSSDFSKYIEMVR